MKIALINGSPKVNNSASGTLLEDIKMYLGEYSELVEFGFHSPVISSETIETLAVSDAWIFAFPLYVDGIPGQLLQLRFRALLKRSRISTSYFLLSVVQVLYYPFDSPFPFSGAFIHIVV